MTGKLTLQAQRDRDCYKNFLLKATAIKNLERHFNSSMLFNFDSRKAIEFGTELSLSKCLLSESIQLWLDKSRML